jgi:hypothetical protein
VTEARPLRLRMAVACSTAVAAFSAVSRAVTRARPASKAKYAFCTANITLCCLRLNCRLAASRVWAALSRSAARRPKSNNSQSPWAILFSLARARGGYRGQ